MATSPSAVIYSMLEHTVEELRKDLQVLEHQMKLDKSGMLITHNSADAVIVHADSKYRAYIPKKYKGFTVEFVEWDGASDIELNLDDELDFESF